ALENAGANEDGFRAEFANERGIGGRGDATGGKIGNGELAGFGDFTNEIEWGAEFLGFVHEFIFAHGREALHLADDGAHVADGFDHVAGAGFALGADHGGAFGDTAQGLTEIARATDEGDAIIVLPDVIFLVGGSEDFALVDEIHFEGLENFGFGEVADAHLGHHGDGDGVHDFADDLDRGHAGDAAFLADVGRNTFEGHDGAGAGLFGDAGLLGVGDVHDDAAFEHFGEANLDAPFVGGFGAVVGVFLAVGFFGGHRWFSSQKSEIEMQIPLLAWAKPGAYMSTHKSEQDQENADSSHKERAMKTVPHAHKTRVRNDKCVSSLPRWGAACCAPTKAIQTQDPPSKNEPGAPKPNRKANPRESGGKPPHSKSYTAGRTTTKRPLARAKRRPCTSRISATRKRLRSLAASCQPSAKISWSTGTGLRYSMDISAVTARSPVNLESLPMASSRTTAMMPPCAKPAPPA